MMLYAVAFFGWDLRGGDIYAAIDLHRIAVDNLAVIFFSKSNPEIALAGCGRADDGDERKSTH
jgi:hypothetical protein